MQSSFLFFFFWDLVFKFPRSFLVMKKRKSRIVLLFLSVLFLKKILSTTTGKIWNFFIYCMRVSNKFNKAKAWTITENSVSKLSKVSHDLDCPKGKTVINKKIQNWKGRFFYFLNNQARNKCVCVQKEKYLLCRELKTCQKSFKSIHLLYWLTL